MDPNSAFKMGGISQKMCIGARKFKWINFWFAEKIFHWILVAFTHNSPFFASNIVISSNQPSFPYNFHEVVGENLLLYN